MPAPRTLTTYEGNTRTYAFRLRKKGTSTFWNVSTATSIRLEWEDANGLVKPYLTLDQNHPDADWTNGRVIVVISLADVTAVFGTFPFSLTVFIGGEIVTVEGGFFEVLDRAGWTAP